MLRTLFNIVHILTIVKIPLYNFVSTFCKSSTIAMMISHFPFSEYSMIMSLVYLKCFWYVGGGKCAFSNYIERIYEWLETVIHRHIKHLAVCICTSFGTCFFTVQFTFHTDQQKPPIFIFQNANTDFISFHSIQVNNQRPKIHKSPLVTRILRGIFSCHWNLNSWNSTAMLVLEIGKRK